MNAFTLGLLMSVSISNGESKVEDYSWVLEEMNVEVALVSDLQLPQNTIKVFDREWNMVGQYVEEQFVNNELPLPDLKEIQESEYLFSVQGDSYYLKK